MTTLMKRREAPASAAIRLLGISAFALALLLALLAPAAAQQVCMARSDLNALLGERFAEKPVAHGLSSSGRLMEIYARDDGGTWTLVVTTPEGNSCVVANGEGWAPKVVERPYEQPA